MAPNRNIKQTQIQKCLPDNVIQHFLSFKTSEEQVFTILLLKVKHIIYALRKKKKSPVFKYLK